MAIRLLLVNSSLFGRKSVSLGLAEELVAGWKALHPDTEVQRRDLNNPQIPHLTAEAFRRRAQATEIIGCAETESVEAADVIVIAAPMVNFSVSSTLKAWIDHIVWARRTFRYAPGGVEGLLSARVFVVSARGRVYGGAADGPSQDHLEPYLRTVLGFIGLRDVTFIAADGQGCGPERAADGRARARAEIRQVIDTLRTEELRAAS